MSKHVPGPWKFDEDTVFTDAHVENGGDVVCFAPDSETYDCSFAHWPANRRLIAAAPELLAFVQSVADNLILSGSVIGAEARALIAKAGGAS